MLQTQSDCSNVSNTLCGPLQVKAFDVGVRVVKSVSGDDTDAELALCVPLDCDTTLELEL